MVVEIAARAHGMSLDDYRGEVDPVLFSLFEAWPSDEPETIQRRVLELAYVALGTVSRDSKVVSARIRRLWTWVVHVYVPTWLWEAGWASQVVRVSNVVVEEIAWLTGLRDLVRDLDVVRDPDFEVEDEQERAERDAAHDLALQASYTRGPMVALDLGVRLGVLPEAVEDLVQVVWEIVIEAIYRGADAHSVMASQVEVLLRLVEELVALEDR